MNPVQIVQAFLAVVTPLAALLNVISRRRRLRTEIKENLELLQELEKQPAFHEHLPVAGWLQGKIALDVAKLSGVTIGARKKPIPKGSVVSALLLGLGFAFWTYRIVENGFVWYSVFPGSGAFLFLVSVLGMMTGREIPPAQDPDLPSGAQPISGGGHREQVGAAGTLAAAGYTNERFADDGQVGVALTFFRAMHEGRYLDAWELADPTWRMCRVQSWLWNSCRAQQGSTDRATLEALAGSLTSTRQPSEMWGTFVKSEREQFAEAWRAYDVNNMGAGSNRRRISADCDLVVLAPLGSNPDGYYVDRATLVPNALVFTLQKTKDGWRLANHLGGAPPAPGWPPSWWTVGDAAVEQLNDELLT